MMVPMPQPSMTPVSIVARKSGARFSNWPITSGAAIIAVNMTSTCCNPNKTARAGPGIVFEAVTQLENGNAGAGAFSGQSASCLFSRCN